MTTEAEYEEHAARGLALLESHAPGASDEIDLNSLDMGDGTFCALAQTVGEGDYSDGLEELGLTDQERAAHFGFQVSPAVASAFAWRHGHTGFDTLYPPLTKAWRKVLTDYRASKAGDR